MNKLTSNSGIVRYFERLENKRKNGIKSNVISSIYTIRYLKSNNFFGEIIYLDNNKLKNKIEISIENDAIGEGRSWCVTNTNEKGDKFVQMITLQKNVMDYLDKVLEVKRTKKA